MLSANLSSKELFPTPIKIKNILYLIIYRAHWTYHYHQWLIIWINDHNLLPFCTLFTPQLVKHTLFEHIHSYFLNIHWFIQINLVFFSGLYLILIRYSTIILSDIWRIVLLKLISHEWICYSVQRAQKYFQIKILLINQIKHVHHNNWSKLIYIVCQV